MRSLVPADSLVYLETNDLAAALQPIIDSKPFTEVAKSKPDFSGVKGVQLAVAVTGFETSEEKINDEQFIGRIQPRFVAVADTHAWNFQAVGFAEQKLGSFVAKIYDSESTLEKSEKNGGKYFKWTAADGRKAYALVIDSLIYFGNDETSIDKCLAVRRGEADSIFKTGKIQPADPQILASGYVSTDGVAQIANIVGLKFASEAVEESEIQSAIARIVPNVLRNSITEISWTSAKTGRGIEDKYLITMPPDVARIFDETMRPESSPSFALLQELPGSLPLITVYNVKNPQAAWRNLVLTAQKQTDAFGAKLLGELSSLALEPYGVSDLDGFLATVGPIVITAKCDKALEDALVATTSSDLAEAKKSLDPQLTLIKTWTDIRGGELWALDDKEIGSYLDSAMVMSGSFSCVKPISEGAHFSPMNDHVLKNNVSERISSANAPITTFGHDLETPKSVAHMLSQAKDIDWQTNGNFVTETRFTKSGIERKTTSDFGLIGSIIAQLGQD